jgi:hypothetical protein
MLTEEKKEQFKAIAYEIYTKEYLGVDGCGIDIEFENEMTEASANFLMTMFYNHSDIDKAKEKLLEVMSKKEPNHPSNLLKLIL